MMIQIILLITLFLMLLVTGVFWGPYFALHRSLNLFSASEFNHLTKVMGKNLGVSMRFLMPFCILFMGITIFYFPYSSNIQIILLIVAFVFMLLSLVITMAVEVPLVNSLKAGTAETMPSNWEALRDKWVRFHAYRTVCALISFVLYTASVLHIV